MKKEHVHILGGGPVGALLSLMLVQKGYEVTVFEKRADPRKVLTQEGRSINMALSHRGIHSLIKAGIFESLKKELIPMKGRLMHSRDEKLTIQPYGEKNQAINSISRARLSQLICEEAEKAGVNFLFGHKCVGVDTDTNTIQIKHDERIIEMNPDILIGADGAFSALRKEYERLPEFNSVLTQLGHGYKELNLAPRNGDFAFEPNYLHIWPRGDFMLIALPNPEKNFTCTLFLPTGGENSFEELQSDEQIDTFFQTFFPDVHALIPDLVEQFHSNPTSNLNMIECFPWSKSKSMIIGDAAHAIVPFYGQGMNAGFEDCRLLIDMLESCDYNWQTTLIEFEKSRKEDTDAISTLALRNFVEMRSKVANEKFLNRKKLEARLNKEYPEIWMPLYSMVTFSDMPYSQCLRIGAIQQQVLEQVDDLSAPENIDLKPIIELFSDLMQADRLAYQ
ncbi:MAG: NAD(P)/FAD-dependent oxidoreductase [Cyclobacteriaceae bacterium]